MSAAHNEGKRGERPLSCAVSNAFVYFSNANFEQVIEATEEEKECGDGEDICFGILTLLSANFTVEGQNAPQQVFQLILKKGCGKKVDFDQNTANATDSSVKFTSSNEFCKQTNPVTEDAQSGGHYQTLDGLDGGIFALTSTGVFNVSLDQLSKDTKFVYRNPSLKWQMEACQCDWSNCNAVKKHPAPTAFIVIIVVVLVLLLALVMGVSAFAAYAIRKQKQEGTYSENEMKESPQR